MRSHAHLQPLRRPAGPPRCTRRPPLVTLGLMLLVTTVVTAAPAAAVNSLPFGTRRSYLIGPSSGSAMGDSLAVGKFDGDVRPDIAAIASDSEGNPAIVLLLTQPDGTFSVQTAISEPFGDFVGLAAGNLIFDDGRDDLALLVLDLSDIDARTFLRVFANLGGTPVAFQQRPINFTVGEDPAAVEVLDFDGNGALDLAVPDADSGAVFLSQKIGATNFLSPTQLATGRDPAGGLGGPSAVAVGRLNGDTLPDLAVALQTDQGVAIHLNTGTVGSASFADPVVYDADPNTSIEVPTGIGVADFNHDGHADIAVSNDNPNGITIHLNNGDGTYGSAVAYPVGGMVVDGLVTGDSVDFDGDGNPDIITRTSTGDSDSLTILFGNRDGTFRIDPTYMAIPVGSGVSGLVVADFNKDGKLDVAVSEETDGTVSVLLGGRVEPPPTKTFTPTRTGTATQTPTITPTPLATSTFTKSATPSRTPTRTVTRTPTVTRTATATRTPLQSSAGDANCDAQLTTSDITALVTKLFEVDRRGQCSGEDANGDGGLSSGDLPSIIRALRP